MDGFFLFRPARPAGRHSFGSIICMAGDIFISLIALILLFLGFSFVVHFSVRFRTPVLGSPRAERSVRLKNACLSFYQFLLPLSVTSAVNNFVVWICMTYC